MTLALVAASIVGMLSAFVLGREIGIARYRRPRRGPPILPGCGYLLPDGREVWVTSVDRRVVQYGVKQNGKEIIWTSELAVFAENATLAAPPKPTPAPVGSVSMAGEA